MMRGRGVGALPLAAVRALLAPVVVLGEHLVDHPADEGGTFLVLAGAFAAWAAGLLALHLAARAGRVRVPAALERAEPFVDLAAIVALTYTSGGPFSQTGMAFFVLPLLAAARLRPAVTARWAAAAVLAYLALSDAALDGRGVAGDLAHGEPARVPRVGGPRRHAGVGGARRAR